MPFEYSGLRIYWLGHDSFKVKNSLVIYFDPYRIPHGEPADLMLISHDHFDHCSPEDISKVSSRETMAVASYACSSCISGLKFKEVIYVRPGDTVEIKGVKVEAVPAYNLNKFRAQGVPFHPKEAGGVGYVIELMGVKIYHAGDTDFIPEMTGIKADIALLPVSGTYVMTPDEAAKAADVIRPKLAIPMHYGTIVAGRDEAERFKRLAHVPVEILEKELP